MKKHTILILLAVMMLSLIGCKKKDTKDEPVVTEIPTPTVVTPTDTPTVTPTEEPENHDGEVISKLTGLWVPEEVGNKRPYAIMFNNIKLASPQSGTSEASILYEAIVEGGITRLMGIFEELNETRIGSVRSARHYFVSFADEYDAIYVHYGETTYATKKIKALGIDNLSGLTGIESTVFFRDKSIKAPHNAFATKDGILKGTEKLGYRTDYENDYEGHFKFYEKDTDLSSDINVEQIVLNFTNYTSPYFNYNKDDKLYYRFQFGTEHIDYNTGKQLAFKNIIVQFVKEWDIDKNDYQTMDIENAKGTGYYITNGKKIDITWQKNEQSKKMRYYDSAGNELTINPGKTYIAVFPNNQINDVNLNSERKK
ncbi:MAG: putative secreted protein [Anaerocolumna sp.]|jgi:hypothetical protein|nr:putative secreted protein [Anaerocolumna sp.]